MIVGKDCIISPNIRVRRPHLLTVGDHSIIDDFCYISCELIVGRYTHIGPNCTFIGGKGKIVIGDFVNIAPGCRIASASHNYITGGLSGPTIPEEFAGESEVSTVTLADHVLLGCNTVVLPYSNLPEGVAVGALSLVKGEYSYQPWGLYIGIPAHYTIQRSRVDILAQAEKLLCSRS